MSVGSVCRLLLSLCEPTAERCGRWQVARYQGEHHRDLPHSCLDVTCADCLPVEFGISLLILTDNNVCLGLVVHPVATDVVVDTFKAHGAEADHAAHTIKGLRIVYFYAVAVLRTAEAGSFILLCHSSLPMPLGLVLATGSPCYLLFSDAKIILLFDICYHLSKKNAINYQTLTLDI